MTNEFDALVSKIRKLQALTSSSNEHEAALAAAKMQEIIEKHQISMLEIEKPEDSIYDKSDIQSMGWGSWQGTLLHDLSVVNDCRCIYQPHLAKMAIVGRADNRAMVEEMFLYFSQEINRLSLDSGIKFSMFKKMLENLENSGLSHWEAFNKTELMLGYHIDQSYFTRTNRLRYNKWVDDFKLGCATEIGRRLKDEFDRKRQTYATNVTALIVREKDRVDEAVRNLFPNLGYGRGQRYYPGSAFNAGSAAGSNVGLNRVNNIGGGVRRITG